MIYYKSEMININYIVILIFLSLIIDILPSMKFATLAMVIATASATPPQCNAIKSLAPGDTCLCDSTKPELHCLTKD